MNFYSLSKNEQLSSDHIINESILNFHQNDKDILSNECDYCSKIFLSKYGLNYHINMYHPNQSILCSECNLTFRSHRALKNHQQRLHSQSILNYNYISSYLVVAFSTQQFTLITKTACEQERLPLGELSSKLFQCHLCYLSFPCSNALKYHLINKHEQYEYELCQNILYDIILQVEQNLRTVDNEYESMKILLSKQASQFGLIDKQLSKQIRTKKQEEYRSIFPRCQHQNRTCANLCLDYLSSYNKLIRNYPYKISTTPKGSPFTQGSIVSKPNNGLTMNNSIDSLHSNPKRTSLKRVKTSLSDESLSSQPKRRFLSQQFKTNETTSTRSSRQPTLKRSLSPTITLAVERSSEKRRRRRQQRKAKVTTSSDVIIKIDDDIEQENDDDDDDDDVNTSSIRDQQPKQKRRNKQRRDSDSSVEYVQILNNDQQSILKSKSNDEDIIICNSPPSIKNVNSSPVKNHSKTSVNGVHKINGHETPEYDENIRVRCKICGEILEGRSRFSQHVLTMHSHLLNNNMSNMKQQQTTTVR